MVDTESRFPLPGVTIALYKDSTLIIAASTDVEGNYRLDKIPIGRYKLVIKMLGYDPQSFNNLILSSGHQLVFDVKLEENSTNIDAVEVTAYAKEGVVNEMALISNRTFQAKEQRNTPEVVKIPLEWHPILLEFKEPMTPEMTL